MHLLKNEMALTLLVYRKNLLETLLAVVGLNAVFLLYIFGVMDVTGDQGGPEVSRRFALSIAGLFAWNLLLYAVSGVVSGVMEEFRNGTIDQLTLSGQHPLRVFLLRLLTTVPLYLLVYVGTLLLLSKVAGVQVHLDLFAVLHMLVVVFAGFGVGFMVLALLLFLQLSAQLSTVFNLALVPLIFGHFEPLWVKAALPIHLAVCNLKEALTGAPFSLLQTALAGLSALFYLLLGLFLYARSVHHMKLHGNRGIQ